jgi:folate-dependent phosphoribosylglycinamide formyltransferase PurN
MSESHKKSIVVLISGNGTNLQAIIDAIKNGLITNAEIKLVVSNRKDAFGLKRAESASIPTLYFSLKPYTYHPIYFFLLHNHCI